VSELKNVKELFRGRPFDREVIILCVRWYMSYKLSIRDLVDMMSERGLHLAHTTVLRWVQRDTGVRQTLESLWPPRWSLLAIR
jgi:transposase-like protein